MRKPRLFFGVWALVLGGAALAHFAPSTQVARFGAGLWLAGLVSQVALALYLFRTRLVRPRK